MKIAFLGDVYIDGEYIKCEENLLAGLGEVLKSADFIIANLEAPITSSEEKMSKIGPNLKMSELPNEVLDMIDAFSLANNHIMDYSEAGLNDTIAYLKSKGKLFFGAGNCLENAYKEVVFEHDGSEVAVIGMAENEFSLTFGEHPGVAPLDPIYSYKYISEAVKRYENVYLFIHGGNEFSSLPSPRYKRLCQMYIDMGVASVISSHTHTIGPIENYKGKPIFYSLGNCLFNNKKPPKGWGRGLIALLEVSKDSIVYDHFPFKQSVANSGASLLTSNEKDIFELSFTSLCNDVLNPEKYSNMWIDYIDKNARLYLFRLSTPFIFKGAYRILSLLKLDKIFYSLNTRLLKLNYISCESHREVVISSLSKEKK
ncbi:CapA family protein [Vibrio fortis]|uniref:CapA family protein n=1 Tax=Vibrio fortis TaxID=212667 RepID=UPI002F3F04AA